MSDDLARLRALEREDRKLIERAAAALAEIDRSEGLTDEQADVLAALRIRLEGRARTSLEELLSAAGGISGKRELGEVLEEGERSESGEWPEIEEETRDWPGL